MVKAVERAMPRFWSAASGRRGHGAPEKPIRRFSISMAVALTPEA